jgi:hypothetical protein
MNVTVTQLVVLIVLLLLGLVAYNRVGQRP